MISQVCNYPVKYDKIITVLNLRLLLKLCGQYYSWIPDKLSAANAPKNFPVHIIIR